MSSVQKEDATLGPLCAKRGVCPTGFVPVQRLNQTEPAGAFPNSVQPEEQCPF